MKINSEWLLTTLSLVMFFMATHNFFTQEFSVILFGIALMILIMTWIDKLNDL